MGHFRERKIRTKSWKVEESKVKPSTVAVQRVMEGGERKSREILERGERKCLFGGFRERKNLGKIGEKFGGLEMILGCCRIIHGDIIFF